jgi:hypothetical protein
MELVNMIMFSDGSNFKLFQTNKNTLKKGCMYFGVFDSSIFIFKTICL